MVVYGDAYVQFTHPSLYSRAVYPCTTEILATECLRARMLAAGPGVSVPTHLYYRRQLEPELTARGWGPAGEERRLFLYWPHRGTFGARRGRSAGR